MNSHWFDFSFYYLLLWTRKNFYFDLEFFREPKPVNITGIFYSSFSRNSACLVPEFATTFTTNLPRLFDEYHFYSLCLYIPKFSQITSVNQIFFVKSENHTPPIFYYSVAIFLLFYSIRLHPMKIVETLHENFNNT